MIHFRSCFIVLVKYHSHYWALVSMSKLNPGLLVLALLLPLVATLPATANINNLLGNIEKIDTVDLTELATGKNRQTPRPQTKPKPNNHKNQKVVTKQLNRPIKGKASQKTRQKYAGNLTNRQSLAENQPVSWIYIAPPFDSSILSDLF
jgi:hypothetical protein